MRTFCTAGSATLPFFGVQPCIVDEKGNELTVSGAFSEMLPPHVFLPALARACLFFQTLPCRNAPLHPSFPWLYMCTRACTQNVAQL